MKSRAGHLAAPFPWFGAKSGAVDMVWSAFGQVDSYVEPFAGSAAMLLGAPDGERTETINDADGFVANFWRAIANDPQAVAAHADWPINEVDLFARHLWLVNRRADLVSALEADPEHFDAKVAGWWCWGLCNWIGSGWCDGDGPWSLEEGRVVHRRQIPHLSASSGVNRQIPHLSASSGVNRKIPHLSASRGVNRQIPHLSASSGVNRKIPHLSASRGEFIAHWFERLRDRLREVRVTCGDWSRVVSTSATTYFGTAAVFLDPPYTKGAMDYAAGGTGGAVASDVRDWCLSNGANKALRIVLCGHAGEHDALLDAGWSLRKWSAHKGYARTDEARENSKSETIWCSPGCIDAAQVGLFDMAVPAQ